MSDERDPRGSGADHGRVTDLIAEFTRLEAGDPLGFERAVAANIREAIADETAALRSAELAFKSLAAVQTLLVKTDEQIRRFARDPERLARVKRFRLQVERERRILQHIVDGERARRGIIPNSPNPRRRAERRLWSEALAGPVPAGRARELLEEEIAKKKERQKQAKQARRDERRSRPDQR